MIRGPFDPAEMDRFLDSYFYGREAFLVDEVSRLDADRREIEATLDTSRPLPFSRLQRVREGHPRHVAGGEIVMVTASLGCLHAWFFHGCRWDEGWVGFGSRIHRAEFRSLARIGPPLRLQSRETRTRIGSQRIVARYEFDFRQEGTPVYRGDQTATFLKSPEDPRT